MTGTKFGPLRSCGGRVLRLVHKPTGKLVKFGKGMTTHVSAYRKHSFLAPAGGVGDHLINKIGAGAMMRGLSKPPKRRAKYIEF